MKIVDRYDFQKVLFEDNAPTTRITLESAVKVNADLRGADLHGADLHGANLHGANLHGANLYGADLHGADLHGADLRGADLQDDHIALLNFQIVPERGEFMACKKVLDASTKKPAILWLTIPHDAKRTSSLIGRKCRVSAAIPAYAESIEGQVIKEKADYISFFAGHNGNDGEILTYKIGERIKVEYDPDPRVECSKGIHCFITRKEAVEFGT